MAATWGMEPPLPAGMLLGNASPDPVTSDRNIKVEKAGTCNTVPQIHIIYLALAQGQYLSLSSYGP